MSERPEPMTSLVAGGYDAVDAESYHPCVSVTVCTGEGDPGTYGAGPGEHVGPWNAGDGWTLAPECGAV